MEFGSRLVSNTLQYCSHSTEYFSNLVDWFCIDLQGMFSWFWVQHSWNIIWLPNVHKKYIYVFNTEKYTHINPGIYLHLFIAWNNSRNSCLKSVFKCTFRSEFDCLLQLPGTMIYQILCFKFSKKMLIVQIIIESIIMNHDS